MCVCMPSVAQARPSLCDPLNCSPPGSSVHGIFQSILEWVAIYSFRGSSWPRDWTHFLCLPHWQVDSLPLSHLGSPNQPLGKNTGVDCPFLLQGIFLTQDWTWVSCIASRFFTVWVSRGQHPTTPTKKKRKEKKNDSNLQLQILGINYSDKTKKLSN